MSPVDIRQVYDGVICQLAVTPYNLSPSCSVLAGKAIIVSCLQLHFFSFQVNEQM